MKHLFLLVFTLILGHLHHTQAQGHIWRTIKLDSFPNTAFTSRYGDFREILVKGVLKKEIKAYKRTGNFADFSQPFTAKELLFRLKQYETIVEDLVDVRPEDFHTIELQETYDFVAKNKPPKDRYTIKSLSLFTSNLEWQYLTLMFRYEDVKKYLEKAYINSRKHRRRLLFMASWQPPSNPAFQLPVTEALEKRFFVSKITETSYVPDAVLQEITAIQDSVLTSQGPVVFCPDFLQESEQVFYTKINYRVDLKQAANATLYQAGQGLVKSIVEGVKQRKIKPYYYSEYWDNTTKKTMERGAYQAYYQEGFLGKVWYYDDLVQDSLEIHSEDIRYVDLLGWIVINTQQKKLHFKATRLTLWLPGKTHSALPWPFFWAQFDFEALKKYWEADQGQISVWSSKQNREVHSLRGIGQLNFADIIREGAFKGTIDWFLNRRDESLEAVWKRYLKKNHLSAKEFPLSKARQCVQMHLNKLTKGTTVTTKR